MSQELTDSLSRGFTAALVIPAVASTLKQAQREAADDLHVLAAYYRDAADGKAGGMPALDARTRRAAEHFGQVLIEQGINGTAFFLAVQMAVAMAGPVGGMLAQVGITGNTIVTPQQTQKFNPARTLFSQLGGEPDWFRHLSEPTLRQFAYISGKFADWCGYGLRPLPTGTAGGAARIVFEFRGGSPRPAALPARSFDRPPRDLRFVSRFSLHPQKSNVL